MRLPHALVLAFGVLLPAACSDSNNEMPLPSFVMRLQEVFGSTAGLGPLMDLEAPPRDTRLFIAERPGRIRVVQGGMLRTTPFLDITSRVAVAGEAGLLSFAFDPQFSANGFVYVHFVENIPGTTGDIVVERYQVSSTDPNVLQTPGTGVIRIPHRDANNHYGGLVAFGPDGMLYLSAGDGGGANNQFMHAQDAASHLGKLMRIDVRNLNPGAVPPYAIPPDNPTWGAAQPSENWAIGLRNPFRYAFDAGQLYIADVGQDQREEIDVVAAGTPGLNYGWSIMEGLRCFPSGGACNMSGLTLPVYDYDHSQGCAIIGGYVYRGTAIPTLQGQYLFSDNCSGFVRSLSIVDGVVDVRQATASVGNNVVQSFGQDAAGELYILTGDGRVLQIVSP
jgi:glucose/arabinose dehydrogenase